MPRWFQRKPKNRRLGRNHVLDVKVRSEQARSGRVRAATAAVGIILGTAAGLFLLYHVGMWVLEEGVLRNEAFAIRTLDVQTDGIVPLGELRRRMEVRVGDNLLGLDLGRVKRDLELEPWVREVTVERLLPHTLRVHVSERDPVAKIHAIEPRRGGGYAPVVFLVDVEGYVMRPRPLGPGPNGGNEYLDSMPSLEGLANAELRPGQRLQLPLAQAALRLVLAYEDSAMFGLQDLDQIDIRGPGILRVSTRQGSRVVMSLNDFPLQLARWHAIHAAGLKRNKAIATLDLSVTNNLPTQWMEASSLPPAPAKAPKTLRHRKRHV